MKTADLPTQVVVQPEPAPHSGGKEYISEASLARWEMVSVIKKRWEKGEKPDTFATLAEYPDLINDPSILLDLAYTEYWTRRAAGENVDPQDHADRFPACQEQLERMLGIKKFLEANPDVLRDAPMSWPNPGDGYLGFTLVRELGRGGFARVFLAEEWALGNRKVAIKISKTGAGEAETLGRLEHPHIVPIHSVRPDPATGLTVVCMPFKGEATLVNILKTVYPNSGAKPPRSARIILEALEKPTRREDVPDTVFTRGSFVEGVVNIGLGVAQGLVFMHGRDVVHRDVKPANVLMGPDAVPRILDFNLARDDDRTGESDFGGTPSFMAPEQLEAMPRGRGALAEIGPAADVFSLGVILYQLLTGEHPFGPLDGMNEMEVGLHLMNRHRKPARPLAFFNPRVDGDLVRLVEQCLATAPEQRPTAQVVAERLEQVGERLRRRRHRWAALPGQALSAAALLLALTGMAGAGIQMAGGLPPGAEFLKKQGDEAYQQGDFQAAIAHYDEANKQNPASRDVLFARARAKQQLGSQHQARLFENQHLGPKHAHNVNAKIASDTAFQDAIKDYNAVDPTQSDWRVLAGIGFCEAQRSDFLRAIDSFVAAEKAGGSTPGLFTDLGHCYLRVKDPQQVIQYEKAQQSFKKALDLRPDFSAAFYGLTLASMQRVHIEKKYIPYDTLAHIETALKLSDTNPEWSRDAARCYTVIAIRESAKIGGGSMGLKQAALLERSLGDGLPVLTLFQGVVQSSEESFPEREDWLVIAMRHASKALDLGMKPAVLSRDLVLKPLCDNPSFKELLDQRAKQISDDGRTSTPKVGSPFVDPIEEGIAEPRALASGKGPR